MRTYYLTTRAFQNGYFSHRPGQALQYGIIDRTSTGAAKVKRHGSEKEFYGGIAQAVANQPTPPSLLVFIHGAANSMRDAEMTAATLCRIYATHGSVYIPILFSYPCSSNVLNYFEARANIVETSQFLGEGVWMLHDLAHTLRQQHGYTGNIFVVAHSLGNYCLQIALLDCLGTHGRQPSRFIEKVFLMHADVDKDALNKGYKLKALSRVARKVAVYFDTKDPLTGLPARSLKRIGKTGPACNLRDAHKALKRPERAMCKDDLPGDRRQIDGFDEGNAFAFDCTKLNAEDRHQAYRRDPTVVRDVQRELAGDPLGRQHVQDGRGNWVLLLKRFPAG